MKGRGNAVLDRRSILRGAVAKNRHVERREGAPARKGRRGAFAEVPQVTRAVSALRSLTYGEGKEKREALAPRLLGRGR